MVKNLSEVDYNDTLWEEITNDLQNGWQTLEGEIRFAFETTDNSLDEGDIEQALGEKFPTAESIEVTEVKLGKQVPDIFYFGASLFIYESGIC